MRVLENITYLTIWDIVSKLGLSRKTIYHYINIGLLTPDKKLGRDYLFSQETYNRLLESFTVKTDTDSEVD